MGLKKMIQRTNRFQKMIPVREIGDLIRCSDGKYRMVLKITDPLNIDLLSLNELDQAVQAIRGALNGLQENQTMQILVHSDTIDIDEYLFELGGRSIEARKQGRLELSGKYVTGGLDLTDDKVKFLRAKMNYLERHRHTARNIHNFYVVLTSTTKKRLEAQIELQDLSSHFLEKLDEGGLQATRLKKEAIQKIMYDHLAPVSSLNQPYMDGMDLMAWRPPEARDRGRYLEQDHLFHAIYTVSYIPAEREAGWLEALLHQKVNMDISIPMVCSDKGEVLKQLNGKIAEYRMNLELANSELARQYYEEKVESTKKQLQQMRPDSENLFSATFLLKISEESEEKLRASCRRLERNVQGNELRVKRINYMGTNLLNYFIPIDFHNRKVEQRHKWQLASETAASMLPFNSSELNYNTGILRGFNKKTESPAIIDPWDKRHFPNRNEFKAGASGGGKSVAMMIETLREWYAGTTDRQFLIDVEREFHRLPGANRIIFKPGSKFCTNPFHIRSTIADSDSDEDETTDLQSYIPRKISIMESFFRWIYPDMSNIENSRLTKAIEECYNDVGLPVRKPGEAWRNLQLPDQFPTLEDLYRKVQQDPAMSDFCLILEKYVTGIYASMFNGQTNWDLDAEINVLDIHELTNTATVSKPLMDLLLGELWEEIKKDRDEKTVLRIDELGLIADERNPQTMMFCHDMAKRIRKYRGALSVATQNTADYLSVGKWGTAIINNCEMQHLFGMKAHDLKQLIKDMELEFSEKERRILPGKKKAQGHSLLIVSGKRIEIQTDFTPEEQEALNIEPPEETPKDGDVVSMVGL